MLGAVAGVGTTVSVGVGRSAALCVVTYIDVGFCV